MFERVGATWLGAGHLLVNHDGIADSVYPAFVTHDVLPGLAVRLQAGRHLTADDDRRGAAPVLLLSDRAWRRIFASDPRIVGRTVRLGASAATIVGIVAPGFRGLSLGGAPDVFVPLHAIADVTDVPMNYFAETNHVSSPTAGVQIIGRLRDGITPAQAARRLDSLPPTVPGLERRGAQSRLGLTPLDIAARTGATKAGLVTFARLLAATVSLTLLVGCGTVALLLFVGSRRGAPSSRPVSPLAPLRRGSSAASRSRPPWWRGPGARGRSHVLGAAARAPGLRAARRCERRHAGCRPRRPSYRVALASAIVAVGPSLRSRASMRSPGPRPVRGSAVGLNRRPSGRYLRDAHARAQVAPHCC